ncbi:hypothetical protein J8V57_17290 [Xenorhabdus sp. PB61.4]|uniref:hypothetical protein n=1 Tax=Xenorhabdus sp. PB61.4 TaxID=2788940 RepID=UPI001E4A3C38|nr:hypothetical protein [Xenorhabdus sp. PB61.4]MCC8367995.1 hypothetical protein [Xenorhabdus sp. PB61.4]
MLNKKTVLLAAVISILSLSPASAITLSFGNIVDSVKLAIKNENSSSTNQEQYGLNFGHDFIDIAESRLAIGFSPEGSAQKTTIDFIHSAKKEINKVGCLFVHIP